MVSDRIEILLVDDHQILREGLKALLESEADLHVIAEASTGAEAIRLAGALSPDVIVLDLGLPDMSGLEVVEAIRNQGNPNKIVVLSMHSQQKFVRQAVELGCDGYVPKSSAHESLLEAIRVVHAGESFLHPKAATALIASLDTEKTERDRLAELSVRELEVLKLTAMGYTNREIGEQLHLSSKTVDTYRQRAMEKLALEHRTDLVRFALKSGLLKDIDPE